MLGVCRIPLYHGGETTEVRCNAEADPRAVGIGSGGRSLKRGHNRRYVTVLESRARKNPSLDLIKRLATALKADVGGTLAVEVKEGAERWLRHCTQNRVGGKSGWESFSLMDGMAFCGDLVRCMIVNLCLEGLFPRGKRLGKPASSMLAQKRDLSSLASARDAWARSQRTSALVGSWPRAPRPSSVVACNIRNRVAPRQVG